MRKESERPSEQEGLCSCYLLTASGATGGAAFGATTIAQETATTAATSMLAPSATAGGAAATEGVELITMGGTAAVAKEVGIEAAMAAGAAAGGTATSGLGPLALGGVLPSVRLEASRTELRRRATKQPPK